MWRARPQPQLLAAGVGRAEGGEAKGLLASVRGTLAIVDAGRGGGVQTTGLFIGAATLGVWCVHRAARKWMCAMRESTTATVHICAKRARVFASSDAGRLI